MFVETELMFSENSPVTRDFIAQTIVYYSGLTDMGLEDAICYACGEKFSLEIFSKYIEEKAINSQVFPTNGMERCKKFSKSGRKKTE